MCTYQHAITHVNTSLHTCTVCGQQQAHAAATLTNVVQPHGVVVLGDIPGAGVLGVGGLLRATSPSGC